MDSAAALPSGPVPPEHLTFRVPGMDCGAEEQLVRLRLEGQPGVLHLAFDLPARTLVVTHRGDAAAIERQLAGLGLGAALVGRAQETAVPRAEDPAGQRRVLVTVLAINAGLFVLELGAGLLSRSLGLVADSFDMLADALVYGLSLWAVGRAAADKKRVARLSGFFQLALAVLGFAEVVRRFLGGGEAPDAAPMLAVSFVALLGNAFSLRVLAGARSREVHLRASQIFTANDVLVNLGVIVAGGLVWLSGSAWPDLLVGTVVFGLVASGAWRILRLSR
ncbi:cation transporter [Deinococcus sp. RL]|uniref:cation transporter n=1 Tax=Deinococcus sp. RL TaxID=1489678 RepID=UPI0004D42F32|nr:cation transporter [Deinococcus sp. RL]KEF35334.1 cation transporter [Deinococcus sp. RL]